MQEIIRYGSKTSRIGSYIYKTLIFLISRQEIWINTFFSHVFNIGENREFSNKNQLVYFESTLRKGKKLTNISYLSYQMVGLFHDIGEMFSCISYNQVSF